MVPDSVTKAEWNEDDVICGSKEDAEVDRALEIDVFLAAAVFILLTVDFDVFHVFTHVLHHDC